MFMLATRLDNSVKNNIALGSHWTLYARFELVILIRIEIYF